MGDEYEDFSKDELIAIILDKKKLIGELSSDIDFLKTVKLYNAEKQLEAVRGLECEWTAEDMDYSEWSTGCGAMWEFNDGGVTDNGVKYCPFCSGKIVVAAIGEGS